MEIEVPQTVTKKPSLLSGGPGESSDKNKSSSKKDSEQKKEEKAPVQVIV